MNPGWLVLVTLLYTLSFLLKGWAWRLYVDGRISTMVCLEGLFASLFVNHVLPVKAGDLVRAGLAAKRGSVSWDEALHSVVVLRSLDLLSLGGIAAAGALLLGLQWPVERYVLYLAAVGIAAVAAAGLIWMKRYSNRGDFLKRHLQMAGKVIAGKRGWLIIFLTLASWILEGAVVFGAAMFLKAELSFPLAVWVTAMTVAGQVFQFTPGGLGTYEGVMASSLALGTAMPLETGFAIALTAHGYKFIYSYASGGVLFLKAATTWKEMKGWIGRKSK